MASSRVGKKGQQQDPTQLVLNEKRIKEINAKIISHHLTDLNLAFNRIKSMPQILFETCVNLRKLNLAGNQLCTIPPAIGDLRELQWLNLSFNEIDEMSTNIGKLTNLYHLDLTENRLNLDRLPKNFYKLDSLERLYLSGNQLEKLTADFGQWPKLRVLCLRDNKIESIHRDVSRLVLLKELHLQGNELEFLPPELAELQGLLEADGALFLSGNPIDVSLQDQVNAGSNQELFEFLKSTTYKIIFDRNKD